MKIQQKLFLAFLFGSLVLVGAMYGLMQWSFDRGMMDYVNQRELKDQQVLAIKLAALYEQNGSWEFLRNNHRLWQRIQRHDVDKETRIEPDRRGFRPHPHEKLKPPQKFHPYSAPSHDYLPPHVNQGRPPPPPRLTLLDENMQAIFGRYRSDDKAHLLAISVEDTPNRKTVGWLALPPLKHISNAFDVGFVKEQQTTFILISVILLVLSACVAYPLAVALTRPIKKLVTGTHQLTSGDYELKLKHDSDDELGQLTKDFNELARTLSANEHARKRWIADISHELRTPITIIRGELEAMLDGIRPFNSESIKSLHQEIIHLQRIVNDLYELVNADIGALTYQKQRIDLGELLEELLEKQGHRAELSDLSLQLHLPKRRIFCKGDETRLAQLINNLINNSIKYTDPQGTIKVSLSTKGKMAELSVEDSSPGVEENHLCRLFEPLFRVESSRNRKTGGSGLGLAICKKIVEGHNGTIMASPSSLGGLSIVVRLPRET